VRPYLEKPYHKKRAGGVARGVGPEFKPQFRKKKNKNPKTQTVSEMKLGVKLYLKGTEKYCSLQQEGVLQAHIFVY
jgi:hypothetical protein